MRTQSFIFTTALAAALALAGCHKPNVAADTANADTANAAAASATPAPTAAAVTTAQGFVTGAAISDMYEVAAAKLAQQKSKTPTIKAFAAKMIHDHGASTAALTKILAGGGVNATAPTAMDERHTGMIDALNQAPPGGFDKAYMDQQVAAHTEAVTLFQGYASGGDNDALKAFAAKVLPTIQAHLDMAGKIDAALK